MGNSPKTKRFAVIALASFAVCLIVIVPALVIQAARRAMDEIEHNILVDEPLTSVKNGGTSARVYRSELLNAFATDQTCISNLTEIVFTSMTVSKGDAAALRELKNVRTLGFQSCEGIDELLPECKTMTLNLLHIESSLVSADTLAVLATSPSITEIHLDLPLSEVQVKVLKSFPASIKVTTTFPLDAYD